MVNENLVNLINKKPVELVQELKDYEIKTSKLSPAARAKVIKKWGGGYVSENREEYGPCSDYRCYGSNACEPGERFFTLYSPCPAAGCPDEFQTATHWVHAKDGCGYSNDKISNKFRIRCPDCFNTSHVKYHRFRCPAHPVERHKSTFWYTSSTTFLAAFAMVRDSIEIPDDVYNQMLKDLRKPENRWRAESND